MSDVIKVGMADLNVATPPHSIRTSGLGSCVGVIIYDDRTGISGMAHVMLPSSELSSQQVLNIAKYADTAIPDLLKRLENKGVQKYNLKAKIAGGAQMFSFSTGNDLMRIGPRNVEAVKSILNDLQIPILAEDVGGKSGRTIEFSTLSKMLHIRTVNQGTKEI